MNGDSFLGKADARFSVSERKTTNQAVTDHLLTRPVTQGLSENVTYAVLL